MTERVLGMTTERFLRDYWGKRPLLVRGAFAPEDVDLFSAEELAGLSLEDEFTSRLIRNAPPDDPSSWTVEHGPFDESDFLALPESHWTLLVQEVERVSAGVAGLTEPFRFVPNWLFDDVMVSYAAPGGGVGAHVDRYDVFLIQGMGSRTWRVGAEPVDQPRYVSHDELELLAHFQPSEEWRVDPGDLIYLPPMVGHDGVALTASVTYSVGFRVPSVREVLLGYIEHYADGIARDRLLRLPATLESGAAAGVFDHNTLDAVRAVIRAVAYDDAEIDDWFGSYVTASDRRGVPFPGGEVLEAAALKQQIREGATLAPASPRLLAAGVDEKEHPVLYAGGRKFRPVDRELARVLSSLPNLDAAALSAWIDDVSAMRLIAQLVADGVLRLSRAR